MSTKNLFRVGGIFAFIGLGFTLADFLTTGVVSPSEVPMLSKLLNVASALTIIPLAFALYQLYREEVPTLSMTAMVEALLAVVLFAICMLFLNLQPLGLYNFAFMAVYYLPPLLFGLLAYKQLRAGMPRALGVIGMAAGLAALVRFVVLTSGGGDWATLPEVSYACGVHIVFDGNRPCVDLAGVDGHSALAS